MSTVIFLKEHVFKILVHAILCAFYWYSLMCCQLNRLVCIFRL
jgi:hypothetical protein